MSKPIMTVNIPGKDRYQDDDADPIVIPTKIRVEKEGKKTRIFCAETGAEIQPVGKTVKVDLSDGKLSMAKITIEVEVVEVVMVQAQIGLPFGG